MIGDTPRLLDFLFLQRSIPRSMFSPWDVPSTLSRPQMRIYTLRSPNRQKTYSPPLIIDSDTHRWGMGQTPGEEDCEDTQSEPDLGI